MDLVSCNVAITNANRNPKIKAGVLTRANNPYFAGSAISNANTRNPISVLMATLDEKL